MDKRYLPTDYKPGTLLKIYYSSNYPGEHWIVEANPLCFKGIANNRGHSFPASAWSLSGTAIVKVEIIKRSDLPLYMNWTISEDFVRVMKGERL